MRQINLMMEDLYNSFGQKFMQDLTVKGAYTNVYTFGVLYETLKVYTFANTSLHLLYWKNL